MRWLLIPLCLLVTACADLGYYWHSASGHLSIMAKRVPIEELLDDPGLDAGLRRQLLLTRDIRRFATERLGLPANGSYTDYAELDRPYALQNLFAAPEFSTRLLSWCYPVAGCTSYRGFYRQDLLEPFVRELEEQGNDVHVGPVPAYSTLGWFDDPVLSSFIHWPETRLAGLLFHELTHQRVYVDGDTRFNESLASAVQQAGTRLWLESRGETAQLQRFERGIGYRRDVVELIELTRNRLAQAYRDGPTDEQRRHRKRSILEEAREKYRELAAAHDFQDGFAQWFAGDLNNAKLGSVSAYHSGIPAFINMIAAHGGDFDAFFVYAGEVGALERDRREACLEAWMAAPAFDHAACG